MDASALRRGNPTANDVWGNEASVLVGDFLYSRSFEMMVRAGSMPVMDIMSVTTNVIAKVTTTKKVAYFTSGHGERAIGSSDKDDKLSDLHKSMNENE